MNDGQAAEIIDIDSDGSEDEEEEEFDTYESSVAYNKPARSNFFSRLNNTVQDDEEGQDKIWVQSTDWMINENKVYPEWYFLEYSFFSHHHHLINWKKPKVSIYNEIE